MSSGCEWEAIGYKGEIKERYGHTMCLYVKDDQNLLIIFGGLLTNVENKNLTEKVSFMYSLDPTNDIEIFDFKNNKFLTIDKPGGVIPQGNLFF